MCTIVIIERPDKPFSDLYWGFREELRTCHGITNIHDPPEGKEEAAQTLRRVFLEGDPDIKKIDVENDGPHFLDVNHIFRIGQETHMNEYTQDRLPGAGWEIEGLVAQKTWGELTLKVRRKPSPRTCPDWPNPCQAMWLIYETRKYAYGESPADALAHPISFPDTINEAFQDIQQYVQTQAAQMDARSDVYLDGQAPMEVDISGCGRCQRNHNDLTFTALTHPHNDYTHWAMCPTVHQPILMKVTDDGTGL